MAGAIAPYTIGALATLPGIGIGLALAITSAFFLLAALLIFTLPDRSGQAPGSLSGRAQSRHYAEGLVTVRLKPGHFTRLTKHLP